MAPVGKTWPSSARRSNSASCEVCGVLWARNEMRRDASGVLRCPDDADGLDATSLDRANAAGATRRQRVQRDPGGIIGDQGPSNDWRHYTMPGVYTAPLLSADGEELLAVDGHAFTIQVVE